MLPLVLIIRGKNLTKRWIWQQDDYPDFTYDPERLEGLLEKVSRAQGYLGALALTMDKERITQSQFEALMSETLSTAAIEGEMLNRDSVKASLQKKLGIGESAAEKSDESTDNLVEILIDANTHYDKALTLERLFGWHHALFPKGYSAMHKINTAAFRGEAPMQIVSGYPGNEKVFYEAPPRKSLEREMVTFLTWFNTTPPGLIKACIAHLWFLIIHPFDDGNGRIARAVTDMVLSPVENSRISRLYSLSSAINADRKGYYGALEKTTGYVQKTDRHLDVTLWCEWFLTTLHTELKRTQKRFDHVIQKTRFWDRHKQSDLNARQIKVLNFILDMGVENFKGDLSKKKYMRIAGAASTTTSRDIAGLLEMGCIRQVEGSGGRSIRYVVVLEEAEDSLQ